MKKCLFIFCIILASVYLYSCKNDSTSTTAPVNIVYAGKWKVQIIQSDTTTDTATVQTDGSFEADSLTLEQTTPPNYIAKATGRVDNSQNIYATITYKNITLPYATTLSGYSSASGNLNITLYYNGISIGTITGGMGATNISGSGLFTSPLFSGSWLISKIN